VSGKSEDPTERSYPGFANAEYMDWIRRGGRIPAVAQRVLERLQVRGLHATVRSDEMHLVRLGRGQTYWLEFEGRDQYLLPRVKVYGETQKYDLAIIAAMTNELAIPTDMEHLRREVLPRVKDLLKSGESLENALVKAGSYLAGDIGDDYRLDLLKYFRPDLAEYPPEEQVSLFEETCRRMNELLEASRKFVNFLEFGKPARDLRPERENVAQYLRAAILRDVGGLTYRQIGERLSVSPPPDAAYKGDYPVVRQMVGRGREALQQTFGAEGWNEKAEAMKAEAERQREAVLGRMAFLLASELDMSEEEVRGKFVIDPVEGMIWDEELRRKYVAWLDEEGQRKYGARHIRWSQGD
jgi:hypothetical protein